MDGAMPSIDGTVAAALDGARGDAAAQADRLRRADAPPDELRAAARQFEAMVLQEVMRPLRESTAMLDGGTGGSIARDMWHQAIVERVAEAGGIGLADAVLSTMGRSGAARAYGAGAPAAQRWPDTAPLDMVAGARGSSITSGFGMRLHPIKGDWRMHQGVDVSAPTGTPVLPVRPGTVTFAGPRGGYGQLVEVDHGDGLTSRYGHLDAIHVEPGDVVGHTDRIGDVGSTGLSTGPHLHLEIRDTGVAVDPLPLLEQWAGGWDDTSEMSRDKTEKIADPAQVAGEVDDEYSQYREQASSEATSQDGSRRERLDGR